MNTVTWIEEVTDPTGDEILALPLRSNDADAATVKDYLIKLLLTVWDEQEGFSGKRAFGNSDWCWELAPDFITAEWMPGVVDEDGYLVDARYDWVDRLVRKAIDAL